jgi:hypothetical protein
VIHGQAKFVQENGSAHFSFTNGKEIEGDHSEFYIECSGELLTEKLQRRDALSDGADLISPFFKSLWAMGFLEYEEFKKRTISFLQRRNAGWPTVSRINELWLGGKSAYARDELRPLLESEMFPLDTELELLRGLHQVNLIFTAPIQDDPRFELATAALWKEFPSLSSSNSNGLISLATHFFEGNSCRDFARRFRDVLERIVANFAFLIPVFGLQFYTAEQPEIVVQRKGITTVSFDDLKQFYLDCYEDAAEMLPLLAAFNNLKHRGNFTSMLSLRKDVKSLADFSRLSKGSRVQFFSGNEDFDFLIANSLESGIRNAIGHSSCTFNAPSQVISYRPKGHGGEEKSMTLAAFAWRCWNLFQTHVVLNELAYQTEKMYWLSRGQKSVSRKVVARYLKKSKARTE